MVTLPVRVRVGGGGESAEGRSAAGRGSESAGDPFGEEDEAGFAPWGLRLLPGALGSLGRSRQQRPLLLCVPEATATAAAPSAAGHWEVPPDPSQPVLLSSLWDLCVERPRAASHASFSHTTGSYMVPRHLLVSRPGHLQAAFPNFVLVNSFFLGFVLLKNDFFKSTEKSLSLCAQ